MPRYIDAEKLEQRLRDFSDWCRDNRKDGADFVLNGMLADTPTADVQKVIHGEWNGTQYETISRYRRRIRNTLFRCSVCGKINGRKKTPYCGRCGAKMD